MFAPSYDRPDCLEMWTGQFRHNAVLVGQESRWKMDHSALREAILPHLVLLEEAGPDAVRLLIKRLERVERFSVDHLDILEWFVETGKVSLADVEQAVRELHKTEEGE